MVFSVLLGLIEKWRFFLIYRMTGTSITGTGPVVITLLSPAINLALRIKSLFANAKVHGVAVFLKERIS